MSNNLYIVNYGFMTAIFMHVHKIATSDH